MRPAERRQLPDIILTLVGRVIPVVHGTKIKGEYPALQPQTLFLVGSGPQFLKDSKWPMANAELDGPHLHAPRESMLRIRPYIDSVRRVYMFDRAGVVGAPSFKYHEESLRFCSIVRGMASESVEDIGFDITIWYDGSYNTKIRTLLPNKERKSPSIDYLVVKKEYFSTDLIDKVVRSWVVHKEDEPVSRFMTRDAWISQPYPKGKEDEASLLQYIREKGILHGVQQCHHYQEISMSSQTDSIFVNRAHRNLYEKAGILHRNVTPENILINPEDNKGNRGILANFDKAIRIDDKSPYSNLAKQGPHTYFGDLESFCYVLIWIVTVYSEPNCPKNRLPSDIKWWETTNGITMKNMYFSDNDLLTGIGLWFGETNYRLLAKLHKFFYRRIILHRGMMAPQDPANDYDDFILPIKEAIETWADEPMAQYPYPVDV
ncbi:hypothetical protein M422DRAFT_256519 [Sphaerobolus stellatus SS14]|uniref:Fungal-type protein kinase domain-containing protein n=1 Tax=Sphaerobolus stellatus (strain SS14) TaxID=990650 RepID=A0A0C9VQM9_SPHS4|nr:hypothetical protein M422DRAFT_256519 [Sphaerobolus stellatus SS14]